MFKPINFSLQELAAPEIVAARGERAWELFDERALRTLQALRDRFGRIGINDWHNGGTFRLSGLRPFSTGIGAAYSQHKFGRAFDCKPRDTTVRAMYDAILAAPQDFPFLTVLEDIAHTPTWLHFDCRMHGRGGIWIVKP